MKGSAGHGFVITGLLALLAMGMASAQELPGVPTGPIMESFTLSTLDTAPGTHPERIGGSTAGSVLFSPPANLTDFAALFTSDSAVTSSLDPTSEGALQNSQGGGSSPSAPNSSTWNASGFQTSGAQRSTSSGFISRPDLAVRRSQRFGQESSARTSSGHTASDSSLYSSADFSSTYAAGALAGQDLMQSDVPDLTAPMSSFALGLGGGGTGSMESSIQTPGFSYENFGLSPRPPSTSRTSRRHQRQHSYSTLHERLSGRSLGSTLRSRNSNRLHTGLANR